MPANRRRNGRKHSNSNSVGPYFFVRYSDGAADACAFQRIVDIGLKEAFGEIGSARFVCTVCSVENVGHGCRGVLHVPHEDQRRDVWAALTLLGRINNKRVSFLVTTTGNLVEGNKEIDKSEN